MHNNESYHFSFDKENVKLMPEDSVELCIISEKVSDYTYCSSDENVAVVDKNGVVSAIGYGTTTITANEAHGQQAQIKVLVDDYDWQLTQHSDDSGNQAMFYTLKNLDTGTLIVIDGGWIENADYVRNTIMQLGGKVDYWFLTHFHNDHVDAFNKILEAPQGITINQIYATPLDYEYFVTIAKDWDAPESYAKFIDLTKNVDNVSYLKRDDKFKIEHLDITVFNAYDDIVYDLQQDIPNNCSLVFKIEGQEDSIIFLGDAYNNELFDYMYNIYGKEMEAEYVQAPHHGNSVLTLDKYSLLKPKEIFLDGPEWLMVGKDYQAKDLLLWCEKNDVKTHDYRQAPNVFGFR